jgi:predicted transcriptional regulator
MTKKDEALLANLCDVINRAYQKTADDVPPGWFTVLDCAKQMGLHRSKVQSKLRDQFELGLLDRKVFNIFTGARLYPVPHFKVKENSK